MMNRPLVSIIMNCFNGEMYLSEALKVLLTKLTKLGTDILGQYIY